MKQFTIMLILALTLTACQPALVVDPTITYTPTITLTPTIMPTAKPTRDPALDRVDSGMITSAALAGNLLGDADTRDFYVYLPPGYETSSKRYPVVYVLHWYGGNEFSFLTKSRNAMNSLIKKGESRGMILVFPNADNKLDGSMYMSSPTIGDYGTYISKELVDLIDSTYRTLPGRDSRGITGCSMGGIGSLHLALTYPETFGVAVPMSGFLTDGFIDENLLGAQSHFNEEPKDVDYFTSLHPYVQFLLALTGVAAPNSSKPPFYMDMPFKIVNGSAEIDQEVVSKVRGIGAASDIQKYLAQSTRLNALMIYADNNQGGDVRDKANFNDMDALLTDLGVPHDSVLVEAAHCNYDFGPIFKYMDEHLIFE